MKNQHFASQNPGYQTLATKSWLPHLGFQILDQILATRSWLPDPVYQILATRFWLPDLCYQNLATTSWLPDPGDQILATRSCHQILATRSWLPDPGSHSHESSFGSRKHWFSIGFYKENVISTKKVSIFHWFYKVSRKWSCCGCSGVDGGTFPLQPQHHFFRKCWYFQGFSNIFRRLRGAESWGTFH